MATALSYPGFLAVFVIPPVLALGVWRGSGNTLGDDRDRMVATAAIALVALVYTTPWDNYLVAREVWTYGAGRAGPTLWHAPIAEYAFVLGQTLLVGFWTIRVAGPTRAVDWRPRDAVAGAVAGLAVGVAGLALLAGRTFYLGAILAWAGPVLAVQWAVGWRYLWTVRHRVAVATVVPAVYLAAIDRLAIATGLWTIEPGTATGLTVLGLPVEELVFFALTSLFVVQGLLLYPWVIERWR